MSYIEADCEIILKKDGKVIGLSLVSQPQTEAEMFCHSMPKQLVDGKGQIKIEDGKITFVNPREGEVSFAIEDDYALALKVVLDTSDNLCIHKDGILTPGFKILPKGVEEKGDRIKLTRL